MKRRDFNFYLPAGLLGLPAMVNATPMHKIKTPAMLKKGDKVALISPAGPVSEEKFANALINMENLGLIPVYNEVARNTYGYFSANDEERLADLHQAFADPSIKAVWCLRGGYGCTRILPFIDYKLIKNNPKVFIGYSDITALHLAFYQKAGLQSFHGPVASSQVFSDYTLQYVKALFFDGQTEITVRPHIQTEEKYRQEILTLFEGEAKGKLMGGNLTLLAAMAGTPFAPSFKNKLVFMEEVGEKPYRIDRMLTQLWQASDISKCSGIIFGTFYDCQAKTEENSFSLIEVIQNFVDLAKKPTIYGFPIGHVSDMVTLPMGGDATLQANDNVVIYRL